MPSPTPPPYPGRSNRADWLIVKLHRRRRYLLIRRETYRVRLEELAQARSRGELDAHIWERTSATVAARVLPIDKEIEGIESVLAGFRALLVI